MLTGPNQPADTLEISVLVLGWIEHDRLWQLLDVISKNTLAELDYFETDKLFGADHVSNLSAKGSRLQAEFKTPKYMKAQSH